MAINLVSKQLGNPGSLSPNRTLDSALTFRDFLGYILPDLISLDQTGSGDVAGPGISANLSVAVFSGTTGKIIADGGVLLSTLVVGPASAVNENIAVYDSTTGKLIKDGGSTIAEVIADGVDQVKALYGEPIVTEKVSLSALQLRNIAGTPAAVPGAIATPGKYYKVISLECNFMYGTVPFDNLTSLYIGNDPTYSAQFITSGIDGSISLFNTFPLQGVLDNQIKPNAGIVIFGDGNSSVGDSTVDLYITYRLITI